MSDSPPSPENLLWEKIAHHWRLLGPPLRARVEDAERLHATWLATLPNGTPARRLEVLLLGVTPELAIHPWSNDFHLTALDASEPMLHAIWPGDAPNRRAVRGEWLNPPFPDASFDLIVSDGGLVVLGALEKVAALGRACRRLLRPEGRVVVRHFSRSEPRETPESLVAAVATGEVRDFNVLKLRLLLTEPASGDSAAVNLPRARQTFGRLFPDRAALAERLGCSLETIDTIDAYAGMGDYVFASPTELAAAFAGFEMQHGPEADYPLGACCPVFAFLPRA